jgi:RHH-type proline utilization regulon transcriptional repressor/proline dehydrogenase/delta 1-pyrroline-5-carboxylate dehydrogenase
MAELVPRLSGAGANGRATPGMGLNIDAEEADRLVALARRDRGGAVADPSWPAGTASAWSCRPMASARAGARLALRWPRGSTAGSWCGWSRAPTGTPRSSARRSRGWRISRSSPARPRPMSYIACARKLLDMTRPDLPAIRHPQRPHLRGDPRDGGERPRRLRVPAPARHGRGAARDRALDQEGTRCRIYAPGRRASRPAGLPRAAPAGERRQLELRQPDRRRARPARGRRRSVRAGAGNAGRSRTPHPPGRDLFQPEREELQGLSTCPEPRRWNHRRGAQPLLRTHWTARRSSPATPPGGGRAVRSIPPIRRSVGQVHEATRGGCRARARRGAALGRRPGAERAAVLRRAADLYEAHTAEFFAIAAREAGKTLLDAVAELREAVDFLRYYAASGAPRRGARRARRLHLHQPWNFPLAIFTGQIAAALAAGNACWPNRPSRRRSSPPRGGAPARGRRAEGAAAAARRRRDGGRR